MQIHAFRSQPQPAVRRGFARVGYRHVSGFCQNSWVGACEPLAAGALVLPAQFLFVVLR
jgi:hypothetical protein